MTLLRWLTFLFRSLSVTFTALLFWISFFLDSPPLRNSDHVVVSISTDFSSNTKQDFPASSHSLWLFSFRLGRSLWWFEIFSLWRYLSSAAAATEFCEWVQFGIDVYFPQHKYQVKARTSPWFSAACAAAALACRNHFFRLYQQNKSSESKVKFRQASNCCKRLFKAAKLACATIFDCWFYYTCILFVI